MNKKVVISYILLFAFCLVLVNNIIPHHHHDDYNNFKCYSKITLDDESNNIYHKCEHESDFSGSCQLNHKESNCINVCHFYVNILRIDFLSTFFVNVPELILKQTIIVKHNILNITKYIPFIQEYFSSISNKAPPVSFN